MTHKFALRSALSARFSFQFALSAMGGSKYNEVQQIEAQNRWIFLYLWQVIASNRGKELVQVTINSSGLFSWC
jgi:hypothetical protein